MSKKRTREEFADDTESNTNTIKKQKLNSHTDIKGLDCDEHKIDNNNQNQEILLDIGGIKFKTSLLTLSKYPNSVLFKMFEGKFSVKPNTDGCFFIDRDGTYFRYILNYLRDGTLILPSHDKKHIIECLLIECNYYRLPALTNILQTNLRFETKILKPNDINQIINWVKEEYPNKRTLKWSLIRPSHNDTYGSHDLLGIDALLFVFIAHNKRFGFYVETVYGNTIPMPNPYEEAYEDNTMDSEEELEQLNEQIEDQHNIQHGLYNRMNEVRDKCKDGFVFWLDPMIKNNFDEKNDEQKWEQKWYQNVKYKCWFRGIMYGSAAKLINKRITARFSVDGMKQEISTDFVNVSGVREYHFKNFNEIDKEFHQKEEKIKMMEVFHLCSK